MSESMPKISEYDLQIVNYIKQLKIQRDDMAILVEQQKREKIDLETELEKIVYKLKTLDKSINQRQTTLENYENKLAEAEDKYSRILQKSESLLFLVKNDLQELENLMDKRIDCEDLTHQFNTSNTSSLRDML